MSCSCMISYFYLYDFGNKYDWPFYIYNFGNKYVFVIPINVYSDVLI